MGLNYDQARQRFERDVRPRAGNVLLERNTYLERDVVNVTPAIAAYEGAKGAFTKAVTYAVRFHKTNVVTWYPHGTVIFRHGGFETMSTCDRMNWANGYRVWSERTHLYVKNGDDWNTGYADAVEVAFGGIIYWCGEYKAGASFTYAERQREWQDQANERARERRVEQRDACLDMMIWNPREKWGWNHTEAPGMRVANGVLWGGHHPVAIVYPQPEQGVDANLLVVSRRALKRTKVAGQLVEQAAAHGCKLTFEDHGIVVAETQNRRHA